MSRESCIQHPQNERLAVIRGAYKEATGDAVAAAILAYLEYLANGVLARHLEPENITQVDLGDLSIREFEDALLSLSTDKQIRKRLDYLEFTGVFQRAKRIGKNSGFTLNISLLQEWAMMRQSPKTYQDFLASVKQPRSNNPGQMTKQPRLNDQTTPVKQPSNPGQMTIPPYISNLSNKKVDQVSGSANAQAAIAESVSSGIDEENSSQTLVDQDHRKSPSTSKEKGSGKGKNSARRKRSKPATSEHYPDECLRLYQEVWTPMYVELRGDLDDRKQFVHGFDKLIESGVPLDVVIEGTEYYCAEKMKAIAQGKRDRVKTPPDGVRFFLGKDGGDSYCLKAVELKQMRSAGELSSKPVSPLDNDEWMKEAARLQQVMNGVGA